MSDAIRPRDRVTVAGIPGVHTVAEVDASTGHATARIRLAPGTSYGPHGGGDLIGVEAWRCHRVESEVRS